MNERQIVKRHGSLLYEQTLANFSPRVLLAEDDEWMRGLLTRALRKDGFQIIEARNGAELLDWISTLLLSSPDGAQVDLIISDIRMPLFTGIDVLAERRWADWHTPVILITAFGDEATHVEARRLGAAAVFDKPFDVHDLCTAAIHLVGGH